jgi:hypothetical protein
LRRNEEAPFPQASQALFKQLLRKKHAILTTSAGSTGAPPGDLEVSNILFQIQLVTKKAVIFGVPLVNLACGGRMAHFAKMNAF